MFFDQKAVQRAADRATRRVLSRFTTKQAPIAKTKDLSILKRVFTEG